MERFVKAQEGVYATALAELQAGEKESHWMWFIFPQLRGLGTSDMSHKYGLADLDEAKAYVYDVLLGSRLSRITDELLKSEETDPVAIFGEIDAMKLQSSMTLFAYICGKYSSFNEVLEKFFGGEQDHRTLALLEDGSLYAGK